MDMAEILQKLHDRAERCYLEGDFHCAEVVVKVIHEYFTTGMPEGIWAMASGFPRGMGGSGCLCGTVAGSTMALGMFFGRTEAKDEKVTKAMELAHELHDTFKGKHKVTCCRVLTKNLEFGSPEHLAQCARFAAEMTVETAKIIIREKGEDVLKR
jgi:C_GCAxxG_C_C family probable redox protein